MTTILINGAQYSAEPKETILQVCKRNNIDVPTLCYDKALEPYGACRMCMVELKQGTRSQLVSSCTMPVGEGMEVQTESEEVRRARKVNLEFLLAEAPGSDRIKDMAKRYGVTSTRCRVKGEGDRRCVTCGLCVRACGELMKVGAIGFEGRGKKRKVVAPFGELSRACETCGACLSVCPTDAIDLSKISPNRPIKIPSEFEMGLRGRPSIYIPFDQAVPRIAVIDPVHCAQIKKGACKGCKPYCLAGAIDHDQKDQDIDLNVGAVVVATGFEQYDLRGTEYNVEHPNVITGLEMERILTSSGPTGGHVKRPSDWKKPKSITFVLCSGSRNERHNRYCSKICCMYTAKNARLIKNEEPDIEVNICYIDFRAPGKNYEEYYLDLREKGINLIQGMPSEILADKDDGLMFDVFDKNTQKLLQIKSDMVVLAAALRPSPGTVKMAEVVHLVYGPTGFLNPVHMKIAPVDTAMGGVYLAGTAMEPKPIQDCITDAGAAASRVATFLKDPEMEITLNKAYINPNICIKCGTCSENCVYEAIDTTGPDYKVLEVSCQGCGKCAANCPTGAIDLRQYLDVQIESQMDGILSQEPDSIIALLCTQCGYNAADLAGTSRGDYPSKVKIIKYPCTARVSFQHLVYPFLKGARGVMVVGCLPEQCHYIDGNLGAKDRAQQVKQLLDALGVGSDRLEFFNMSSADGPKFVAAAKRMVDRCY